MRKTIIGITVSQIHRNNQIYDQIPSAYSEAILSAGGFPFLIPNRFPLKMIPSLVDCLDGLLLSGGGDVIEKNYNGLPHPTVTGVSEDRDSLEIALVNAAKERQMPVLGICRGMQVLNVALGGTLIADIPSLFPTKVMHNTPESKGRDFIAHSINLTENSILAQIYERSIVSTNSFHHQAVDQPAPGMEVTGRSSDGLIEALEWPSTQFNMVGVQWHPECLLSRQEHKNLFKAFVSACKVNGQE